VCHVTQSTPTQRLVELHRGSQVLPLDLGERQLGVEQAPLRIQHVEIARDPALVAALSDAIRPAECLGFGLLRDDLVAVEPNSASASLASRSAVSTVCSYCDFACSARARAARSWLSSLPPRKSGTETPPSTL